MKRSVYTIGSLIILLIAAFVFVLVPIFSGGRAGKRMPAFGKYDGTEIRYEQGSDFANYVTQYADSYKNRNIQISNSDYYYLFNSAFNTTVMRLAFTKAVKKSGYKVPASKVNRAMMPYFTDETGKYSAKIYRLADPDRVRTMREDFESTLVAQRYQEDLFGSYESLGKNALYGLKYSDAEIEFLRSLNDEKRSFNMVSFDMNKYPDSEKKAYGKANAEKFTNYDFSVITCKDKAKAETVAKRIASGEVTFADAVTEYSQKSYSNDAGKMNNKFSFQIEGTIKNAADFEKIKALKTDEVSPVIETTVGYSIFRADSKAKDADFESDSTLRTVYSYINSNDASVVENYFNTKAASFSEKAKANGFDSACKSEGLTKVSVNAFPLNWGNTSVAAKLDTSVEGLSGAATNEEFLKTAFSLAKGEVSQPVVNGKNILVLQLAATSKNTEEPVAEGALKDEMESYDSSLAQSALLSSPKLVNNFSEVFFNNFMNND